ncbi:MAG: histidine kinase [Proteobacteria bacterium]|nr:histidine kinase [Pseudomonadota bacterium]
MLNPDLPLPKSPPSLPFDDRPLMTFGIGGFGLTIPFATGLYGPIGPGDARFWVGAAAFLALAAAIWLGNRWLLLEQRKHFDWFAHPLRKLAMLISANVLYTAPLTVAAIWGWLAWSGQPVVWPTIQVVALVNVICVIFVTHAYETVFLIRERESDLMRVERLERMRTQAELAALKAQIDPHFLFNSLNTLGHLIAHDPPRGREFCDTLAEVYRYVLASRSRDLVLLGEELAFVRNYHRLLALRFGAGVRLDMAPALGDPVACDRWLVPPLALQTLVENAVKHNRLGEEAPLVVELVLREGAVDVRNAVRPRRGLRASPGVGLANLDERCRLLTGRGLVRTPVGAADFEVRVPLRPAA